MSEFEVGYKKPPIKSRFKPGLSGNPTGRQKRKPLALAEIVRSAFATPVTYNENGRAKTVTRLELYLKTLIEQAMRGNIGAAETVLKVRAQAQRSGDAGVDRLKIADWLPDYPGQTAEQKTLDNAGTVDAQPFEWWKQPSKDAGETRS